MKIQFLAALIAVSTILSAPSADASIVSKFLRKPAEPLKKGADYGKAQVEKATEWADRQSGLKDQKDKAKEAMDSVDKAADAGAVAAKKAADAAAQAEKTAKEHEILAQDVRADLQALKPKLDRALTLLTWGGFGLLSALAIWVLSLARISMKRAALLGRRSIPATA